MCTEAKGVGNDVGHQHERELRFVPVTRHSHVSVRCDNSCKSVTSFTSHFFLFYGYDCAFIPPSLVSSSNLSIASLPSCLPTVEKNMRPLLSSSPLETLISFD